MYSSAKGRSCCQASLKLTMKDLGGAESQNRTTFTGCRQYSRVNRSISFDDPSDAITVAQAERTLHLPAGSSSGTSARNAVVEGQTAVGDPVTAILKKSVKLGSGLVAPKGALVHGRMTHLRRQQTQPARMGDWDDILRNGVARYTREAYAQALEDMPTCVDACRDQSLTTACCFARSRIRRASFCYPVIAFTVPRGFLMIWRTQPLQTRGQQ